MRISDWSSDVCASDLRCCAAIYVDNSVNPYIGGLNNPSSLPYPPGTPIGDNENSIIQVLTDMGQDPSAFSQGYSRDISVTPGRSYAGKTKDYGFSGQIDYDFGGAQLTPTTGYRALLSDPARDPTNGTV